MRVDAANTQLHPWHSLLLSMYSEMAALRVFLAAKRLRHALQIEARFNPYHDEIGRFTTADGVGSGGGTARDGRVRLAQAGPIVIPNRATIRARFPNATPAQEARFAASEVWARQEIADAQLLIPGYQPAPSLTEGIESEIARNDADARAARDARTRFESESSIDGTGLLPGSAPGTMNEVCVPGGTVIGVRRGGAGMDATTLTHEEFGRLLRDLRNGAVEIMPSQSYRGSWYRRHDKTTFGARLSNEHGLTIDIIDSLGNPQLRPGTRIHYGN